jgi:hypothetical protein
MPSTATTTTLWVRTKKEARKAFGGKAPRMQLKRKVLSDKYVAAMTGIRRYKPAAQIAALSKMHPKLAIMKPPLQCHVIGVEKDIKLDMDYLGMFEGTTICCDAAGRPMITPMDMEHVRRIRAVMS